MRCGESDRCISFQMRLFRGTAECLAILKIKVLGRAKKIIRHEKPGLL